MRAAKGFFDYSKFILVMFRVTAADRDEIIIRQRGATEAHIEVRRRERRDSRVVISPEMRAVTGFSLIEMMISLIILSFLMMGIYTMVDNSQRTKDVVTTEDRALLQVQMALNRLESDVSQIYSPRYFTSRQEKKSPLVQSYRATEQFPEMTSDGHPIPILEHPDDETIMFMTSSNRRKMEDSKQSRWAWVQYTLEDSDSSKIWVRRSVVGNPFAPQVYWDKVRPQVLVKNIVSLEFWFWDVDRKEWVEDFERVEKKLYAVKVKLVWLDAGDIEQTNTRVFRILWPYPNFFYNLLQGVE